ncbi:adenylate/guanylate cyclase domain-containing protein, partial [Limnospira fusiformis]|nr:adenylate/guanylate cyclase domain-containing protein [Limnospira fusiformis LS22]
DKSFGGGVCRILINQHTHSVNIAARLESYDKSFGGGVCRILINQHTHEEVSHQFITEYIGSIHLKGRTQPINVYQINNP